MKMKPLHCLLFAATLLASLPTRAEDHTIVQKDREFSQTAITVKPGEKVVFQNSDEVTHNVFSNSKINAFDLKTQKPGAASEVTFSEEGTTEVRCAIHPKMKVIVTVKK
mgnify:CR=1 FL=1